jgi:DNA-binding transcriptional ArsR family regulator
MGNVILLLILRLSDFANPILPNHITTLTMATTKKKESNVPIPLDYHAVKKASLILRSINHKLRQQILQLINENGQMTVTEIYVKLRLEQSVASQHLAILRRSNIVKTTREGKFIWYSVNHDRLLEVNEFVTQLLA